MDRTQIQSELDRLRALAVKQDEVGAEIVRAHAQLKANREQTAGAITALERLLATPPMITRKRR